METFVQSFSNLVRRRLGELELNAFAAENAAGLPPDAIRNVLRSEKQAGPTLARTKEICDALGLEIAIAPRGALRAAAQHVGNADPDEQAPAGFVTVPWAETGARPGSAPIAFSRHWVADHKLKPDFLQAAIPDVIALPGQHPTDSVALLDSRIGDRKGHNLWCYREAGRVHVAHITFTDQLAVIHPAEPGQPPAIIEEPVSRELRLLGKVVWLGQSVPFKGKIG